ncbi:hypothetical protein QVD17_20295 [Tagetes erecta]|uniref:Uncharacterized protein n=1 Tax=Tagetes erecta TaxID=13708 RepID=A0AAD8NY11_TARER|nr:hypothetical protein QVD17_20295 [Tagetes erecta]
MWGNNDTTWGNLLVVMGYSLSTKGTRTGCFMELIFVLGICFVLMNSSPNCLTFVITDTSYAMIHLHFIVCQSDYTSREKNISSLVLQHIHREC